ncbi:MAG TPA: thioredoxin domain-containing protein [Gemmatimonadales bacterium]|nr:thioredoxin domain-containing protein [Gemmatimonadales bacterium]
MPRSSRAAQHLPISVAAIADQGSQRPTLPVCALMGAPLARRAATVAILVSSVAVARAFSQWTLLTERSLGRANAPVTIYEMSDFQCPYCRAFALTTLPALEREYMATGKVRFVFVNFPLTQAHPYALIAAEVAMCVATQGLFWRFHDLTFRHQIDWEDQVDPIPYLKALADSAGARAAPLARCVDERTSESVVQADIASATRIGVSTTPTFFIEGGLIEGAAPLDVFQQVLDSIYGAKVRVTSH